MPIDDKTPEPENLHTVHLPKVHVAVPTSARVPWRVFARELLEDAMQRRDGTDEVDLNAVTPALHRLIDALRPLADLHKALDDMKQGPDSAKYAKAIADALKKYSTTERIDAMISARKALYRAVNPHVQHEE
jgi:RPA family protein